jgi:Tol biopolymer transport system component
MRTRRVAAAVLGAACLAGAFVVARAGGAAELAGFPTYRPEIQPLGWTAGGHVLFVHTEVRGGYDYRETTPCGGSGIYRTDGRSAPAPVLAGQAWCQNPSSWVVRPSLSTDGRTVFVLPEHGYDDCIEVRALDLDARRWLEAARICGSYVYGPAISPDGRRIALSMGCGVGFGGGEAEHVTPHGCVDRDGDRLTVMNLDGSNRRLVGEPGDTDPVWSPDGRALAVRPTGRGSENGDRIVVINLQTGRRHVVARGTSPAWSPDGQWLAFTRHREAGDEHARVSLHVIRADGTGERRVFVQRREDMRRGPQYPSPGGWPRDPMWSPDGRRIVFTKHFHTGNTLWIVNADGTGLRRLSERIEPAR